jgi:murein DD-endopeptidase MepM/ murein hydrolase activator NlpD
LPWCPAKNCFYRLPWLFPGVVSVAQGNGPGAFSHNGAQQYAFDFSMPDKSTMYATRGGVVGDLVETNTMNFNPCADNNGNGIKGDDEDKKADGPTNYVRVDHLDGTYSYYAHVDTSSVIPQIGETIERGDALAKVGNIGRSCGAHLHYQVAIDKANTIYGQTKQICFEGWTAIIVDYFFSPCSIPKSGNLLLSSNG